MTSPVREYRTVVKDSGNTRYSNRILIGTAVTGLVRVEWMQARYGQLIPCNWASVQMLSYLNSYMPLRYQVADAQNLIVKSALEGDYEWLLLWEHDVCPQPDFTIRLDRYLTEANVPVVSGLYYTRAWPSDPLIYRGRGNGSYQDFKLGDIVYADGVPTGLLLIHTGILRLMWEDSEEYSLRGEQVRRVFNTPRDVWYDPESKHYNMYAGTSDLQWCTDVMKGDYLRRAGWGDYVDGLPDQRYPFMIDTNLFARHINPNGEQFP